MLSKLLFFPSYFSRVFFRTINKSFYPITFFFQILMNTPQLRTIQMKYHYKTEYCVSFYRLFIIHMMLMLYWWLIIWCIVCTMYEFRYCIWCHFRILKLAFIKKKAIAHFIIAQDDNELYMLHFNSMFTTYVLSPVHHTPYVTKLCFFFSDHPGLKLFVGIKVLFYLY